MVGCLRHPNSGNLLDSFWQALEFPRFPAFFTSVLAFAGAMWGGDLLGTWWGSRFAAQILAIFVVYLALLTMASAVPTGKKTSVCLPFIVGFLIESQ